MPHCLGQTKIYLEVMLERKPRDLVSKEYKSKFVVDIVDLNRLTEGRFP